MNLNNIVENKNNSRNIELSIVKGIGIILMVIGHAEFTHYLSIFLYLFHMPLFFIASGYFFSTKYRVKDFVIKRIKGLYIPFIKWSFIFLLLHNLFLRINVLSTSIANVQGDVCYYYTYTDLLKKIIMTPLTMIVFEPFILGAFWFLRALFISSTIFCVFCYLLNKYTKLKSSHCTIIICIVFLILSGLKQYLCIDIPYFPQGGYRELMGTFFFGIGFLSQNIVSYFKKRKAIYIVILFFILLFVQTKTHPAQMGISPDFIQFLIISYTGIIGWFLIYFISFHIKNLNILAKTISFLGENTMPILTFHFLSFKAISLVKVFYYHLDYSYIACFPVIWKYQNIFWGILYVIAGISVPLILALFVNKINFLRFKI